MSTREQDERAWADAWRQIYPNDCNPPLADVFSAGCAHGRRSVSHAPCEHTGAVEFVGNRDGDTWQISWCENCGSIRYCGPGIELHAHATHAPGPEWTEWQAPSERGGRVK